MSEDARDGNLVLDSDAAGLEIRRIAREYRIRPDGHGSDLRDRLDSPTVCARYFAKRGISIEDFDVILADRVTAGRPSTERIIELFATYLPGHRATRAELDAIAREQLETRNVARELVQQQERTVIEFRDRVRRGSKLVSWRCGCTKPVTAWTSYKADFRVTCGHCGEAYTRVAPLPELSLDAIVAASEDEGAPF